MSQKHSVHLSPMQWLTALFQQPPSWFYRQPSLYLSGAVLEIEHFQAILTYNEAKLCLQFPHGRLTIYGDHLRIRTLTAHRITLYGRILRTDFSDN